MRIVICGDTHIGAVYGLGSSDGKGGNTRVNDFEKTLNYIVDYAISVNADAFIQTGDAFDARNPVPEHIEIWYRVNKKLSMNNIPSIILMGNHDYRRSGTGFTSSLTSLSSAEYPNVRIVLEPEKLELKNNSGEVVDLVLLPYRDRRMFAGKTVEEDSQLYDAEAQKLLEACSGDNSVIVIGHNFFYEGSYKQFGGTEVMANISNYEKANLFVMGHYHQFKLLKEEKPTAIYIGSMEKNNFGDELVNKYFIDYDTNKDEAQVLKTPVRELFSTDINMEEVGIDDFEEVLRRNLENLNVKDKITKIRLIIPEKVKNFIKRSYIEKLLYEFGAHYVSGVILEPIIKNLVVDNSILEKATEYEVFEAFLKSQEIDNKLMEEVLEEFCEIVEAE